MYTCTCTDFRVGQVTIKIGDRKCIYSEGGILTVYKHDIQYVNDIVGYTVHMSAIQLTESVWYNNNNQKAHVGDKCYVYTVTVNFL